jgi:signal transduction histidine kinase
MEGARLGEFAAVAEQIRKDVKRKLDQFIQTEQNRPYTDYLYYYVPENVVSSQQQMPLLRSPLSGRMEHGLAYGNFQIEPDGNIITPNDFIQQDEPDNSELYKDAISNKINVKDNLLPVLNRAIPGSSRMNINKDSLTSDIKVPQQAEFSGNEALKETRGQSKAVKGRGRALPIGSLKTQDKETQITAQRRSVVEYNISNVATPSQRAIPSPTRQPNPPNPDQAESPQTQTVEQHIGQPQAVQERQSEMVQVRIGPFETIVTSGNTEESIFGGQVFLLRNVQIEDRNSLQGFQLNENKLIEEVKESAAQAISTREGMGFELVKTQSVDWVPNDVNEDAAYTAILDFGLGYLALNLIETDPDRIGRQISWLRNWYFGIIAIVLLAVSLGLTGLWRSARAQIRLAQKKDDFISAVSHELRTPLTSIRMYSEMLEKNWVKSEDKLTDYYRNMRQESERLSRLIENVLDFSRIQRGRKKYTFKIGNINKCIADVVKIMRPYAAQRGFSIKTELGQVEQTTFDNDAVTQIAVNLLDNAVKYAHDAEDKTITVRTRSDKQFTLIEVEDHGPGVPHRQRKKIFEQFYRSGAEGTRETTGTGLGLALVKKFAQAHNGFVDIFSAKPTGAIFRVTLAVHV